MTRPTMSGTCIAVGKAPLGQLKCQEPLPYLGSPAFDSCPSLACLPALARSQPRALLVWANQMGKIRRQKNKTNRKIKAQQCKSSASQQRLTRNSDGTLGGSRAGHRAARPGPRPIVHKLHGTFLPRPVHNAIAGKPTEYVHVCMYIISASRAAWNPSLW